MVRLAGTFGFHFGTLRRRSPSLQARLAIEALRILRMWGEGRRTVERSLKGLAIPWEGLAYTMCMGRNSADAFSNFLWLIVAGHGIDQTRVKRDAESTPCTKLLTTEPKQESWDIMGILDHLCSLVASCWLKQRNWLILAKTLVCQVSNPLLSWH